MTLFLVIVLIIGNLFLLSGAVFDDLADNGIAWFFVIGAIAMDIYFVYLIAQSVSKSQEQQRIAAENSRIAEVTRKVEALMHKYTLMRLNANRTALPFQIDPDLINKEVVFTVNSYKERMAAIYDRYSFITNEIKRILACTGCISVDDKYSHLTANEDKLKQLKEEGDSCLSHLSSCKIEMLNDDRNLLLEIKLAFRYLLNSKKCQSESLSIKEFITPEKPNDLMMFSFEKYALHAQRFTRIICKNDVLVTTLDYQSWDGETEENNDEWYFVEQNRDKIVGGTVTSVNVNALHDITIVLDNSISIELFVKNGYHHFDDEQEQWVFFKHHDHSYPFITVYNKSVDIAVDW